MTLIDVFNKLGEIGWTNVIIILALIVILTILGTEAKEKFFKSIGYESTKARIEKERDEKIQKLENDIKALQGSAKKFNEDRVHDREQSFEKQHTLTDMIDKITSTQNEIIKKVDDLAEQNRKYQLADIRETLLQAYRYYTGDSTNKMKCWTEMEANAFWEQYATYKDHGGNGYMESIVKPEMNKLRVITLSDVDTISELMESRHQNKN